MNKTELTRLAVLIHIMAECLDCKPSTIVENLSGSCIGAEDIGGINNKLWEMENREGQ